MLQHTDNPRKLAEGNTWNLETSVEIKPSRQTDKNLDKFDALMTNYNCNPSSMIDFYKARNLLSNGFEKQ